MLISPREQEKVNYRENYAKSGKSGKTGKIHAMCSAFSRLILEGFPKSKLGSG